MLDQYIGECMESIIGINNGSKEPTHGYQNCNTNQISIFGSRWENLHYTEVLFGLVIPF